MFSKKRETNGQKSRSIANKMRCMVSELYVAELLWTRGKRVVEPPGTLNIKIVRGSDEGGREVWDGADGCMGVRIWWYRRRGDRSRAVGCESVGSGGVGTGQGVLEAFLAVLLRFRRSCLCRAASSRWSSRFRSCSRKFPFSMGCQAASTSVRPSTHVLSFAMRRPANICVHTQTSR